MDAFLGLTKNRRGQFAIEGVLLLTVLVGGFLYATKLARDNKVVSNLVAKPVVILGNMAGYGTRKPDGCTAQGKSNKETLGKCHPNSIHRGLSSVPDL